MRATVLLALAAMQSGAWGSHDCAWATGRLLCADNQDVVLSAEIQLLDRDGHGVFGIIDDPDLMARAYVDDRSGDFEIRGCGSDRDWLPWVRNRIEPYLSIYHYCNDPVNGEQLDLDVFYTYAPDVYNAGPIHL